LPVLCSKGLLSRYCQHIVADMCDIDKDPNKHLAAERL